MHLTDLTYELLSGNVLLLHNVLVTLAPSFSSSSLTLFLRKASSKLYNPTYSDPFVFLQDICCVGVKCVHC